MELGHLLTRSGLTYPEFSSKVCHDSFCQLGNSVSLPWVIYYGVGPEAESSNPTTGLTLLWARNPFGGNFNNWQVSWEEAEQIFFKEIIVTLTISFHLKKISVLLKPYYATFSIQMLYLRHLWWTQQH